jgi:putative mRNA 3-end processing factor
LTLTELGSYKVRVARPEVELIGGAIHLADSVLWFDSPLRRELSFVSHAHVDHIARHQRSIATDATAQLMRHRLGHLSDVLTVPFFQGFDLGPLHLELYPAGHVFGSAQLLVVRDGRRIVYTGDLSLSQPLTAEAARIVPCDVLVIESTFGHPRYRFPPRAESLARLEEFVRQALAEDAVPVLLTYALGKSQEVIHYLGGRGFPLRAAGTICDISRVYRQAGCPLPSVSRFEGEVAPGEVLLIPPHFHRRHAIRRLPRRRLAVLTGWAVDDGTRFRYGADVAIALSDHADFDQLVRYAEESGARQIYTVHGFSEDLADALAERKMRARPLADCAQLDLFE